MPAHWGDYSAPVLLRSNLEYCARFWNAQHKKDIKLEWVKRRAMKMIKVLELLPYEDTLNELELFSLKKTRLLGNLLAVFQYLKGAYFSK